MDAPSFSDDLRRYVALIWHWAWLLILATILAGAAAYVISKRSTPVFQASTTVLINEAPATKATDYSSLVTSERLAQTYAQLMVKQPVLEGVIDELNLDLTLAELKNAIDVQPVRDTTLIEVRVEDISPQRAANIANILVDQFAAQNQALQSSRYSASKESLETQLSQLDKQINANNEELSNLTNAPENQADRDRLEANQAQYRQTYAYLLQSYEQVRLAEAQSTSNVIQAEKASAPTQPIRPRVLINTLLAGVVGFMVAAGVVFLIEAMDDTLKSPDEITRELGLPVLGMIARHDTGEGQQPITLQEPRSPVSEAFRSLRTNIQFASVDKPLNTLLVTSPSPSEGKSTVAANLGIVMAQSGRRVVVVDADLRRPRIHKVFGLSNRSGISGLFVQGQVHLNGSLQKTNTDDLYALTSGDIPPNPAELLGSEKMFEILRKVQENGELIIVDTPPVLVVTDSAVLAPRVDGVLLVVKPNVTQIEAAKQAVAQLRRVGANILGVVLNEVEFQRSRYMYYRGYYAAEQEKYFKGEGETSRPKSRKIRVMRPFKS